MVFLFEILKVIDCLGKLLKMLYDRDEVFGVNIVVWDCLIV